MKSRRVPSTNGSTRRSVTCGVTCADRQRRLARDVPHRHRCAFAVDSGAMIAVVKAKPLDGPEGTEVRDCPKPAPGPDDFVIRVGATAICGTDKHIYHWDASIH